MRPQIKVCHVIPGHLVNIWRIYFGKCNMRYFLSELLQRFRVFEEWEGFRWSVRGEVGRQKPWFNVRRDCKILKRSMTTCHVSFGCDHKLREDGYRIIGFPGKSELKIIRGENQLVAEVRLIITIIIIATMSGFSQVRC